MKQNKYIKIVLIAVVVYLTAKLYFDSRIYIDDSLGADGTIDVTSLIKSNQYTLVRNGPLLKSTSVIVLGNLKSKEVVWQEFMSFLAKEDTVLKNKLSNVQSHQMQYKYEYSSLLGNKDDFTHHFSIHLSSDTFLLRNCKKYEVALALYTTDTTIFFHRDY